MRTVQVPRGFYRLKQGLKEYKIYASDLKMISKRRYRKTPALPVFCEDDEPILKIERRTTDTEN